MSSFLAPVICIVGVIVAEHNDYSAFLSPAQYTSKSNDIDVSLLKDTSIARDHSAWQILPADNTGFHMRLSCPFAFDADRESTLTLQIEVDEHDLRHTDMIVAFELSHRNYFAILHQHHQDALLSRIYPSCTQVHSPTLAAGNISELLATQSTGAGTGTHCVGRACTLCNNDGHHCDNINLPSSSESNHSTAATTIIRYALHHDPVGNLLSLATADSCVFDTRPLYADDDSALHILIAGDRINHSLRVSSVNISSQSKSVPSHSAFYGFALFASNGNGDAEGDDEIMFDTALVLYIAAGIAAVFFGFCILDLAHSATDCGSRLGLTASDERHTLILLLVGSRLCNMALDVAILVWLCMHYLAHARTDVSVLILVAVSLASLLITYVANLYTIGRVKRVGAHQWFAGSPLRVCVFVALVLVTCDTYLCLRFIASCLHSGHSVVEVAQCRDIKKATILIHNLPQILIQIAFMTLIVGDRNTLILVSVCLSALISVPFVLWWHVCSVNDTLFAWKTYDIDARLVAYDAFSVSGANGKLVQLASMQRLLGHTRKLRRILCDLLNKRWNHLEIGNVGVNEWGDGLNIHVVQKAQNDADFTQLYAGKQAALGKALHALYHISEEWTIETAIFMHGQRKSRNASVYKHSHNNNHASPLQQLQPQHDSSWNMAPPVAAAAASITPFKLSMHAQISQHSAASYIAGYHTVRSSPQPSPEPPAQPPQNIAERMAQVPTSVSRVSDLFGSGGDDNEHAAFAVPNGITDLGLDEIQQTDTLMDDNEEE